jgi:hypothetical protein
MSISRKMRGHVEAKIKHAIATGPLPHLDRPMEHPPKNEPQKTDSNETGQSK